MSYKAEDATFRSTAVTAIQAERSTGQTKNELFWHARKCITEKKGDIKAGLSLFLSRCAEEERWMISEEAGQSKCDQVPALWSQGKSDIKRSIESGFDPREYPSYSSMKTVKIKQSKQNATVNAATKGEHTPGQPTTVEEALAAGTVIDAKTNMLIPSDMLELVALVAQLTEVSRKRCINRLMEVANSSVKGERGTVGQQRKQA